jgi:type III pantothenate kinase
VVRVVADLGNSRLKWARVVSTGIEGTRHLATDDPAAWQAAWDEWGLRDQPSRWAISSVNPPVAERLRDFLKDRGVANIRWYTSAADVPVVHALEHPETTGADRALGVLATLESFPSRRPRLLVSCGSAVVVDRIAADGLWQGGAIAPGMALSARALHLMTAQLPLVTAPEAPPAWGPSTEPALAAGLFWGTVGAIREILNRQAEGLPSAPLVVWTGGDSPLLAPWVAREDSHLVPDLVLVGLAITAFGGDVPGTHG